MMIVMMMMMMMMMMMVMQVSQQSMSWIPLLNIKCHADTQLFLCSLFSPVCLERPIYPCRSLCQVHIVITRAD